MPLTVISATGIANNQSYTFGSANVTGNLIAFSGAIFNSTNVYSNVNIQTGYSGMSVGPLTIANNVTITIASGQKWVIL